MLKFLKDKKKDNKGFTLVELVIVVAILAILVGILALIVLSSDSQFLDLSFVWAQLLPANSVRTLSNALTPLVFGVTVVPFWVIVILYVLAAIVSVLSEAAVFTTVTKFSRFAASAAFLDFSTYLVYCGDAAGIGNRVHP